MSAVTEKLEEMEQVKKEAEAQQDRLCREALIQSAGLYITYLTRKRLGIVMPGFSQRMANGVAESLEQAVEDIIADPRAGGLAEMIKEITGNAGRKN